MSYPLNILIKHRDNKKFHDIMQKMFRNRDWEDKIADTDDTSYAALAEWHAHQSEKTPQSQIDIWRGRARVREFKTIFDAARLKPRGPYLDFGAGSGVLSSAIGRAFRFDTYATDISVWHGGERKCAYDNVEYKLLDGEGKIPFDKKFHVVSCLMVLHHIKDRAHEVVRDIRAHMLKGGVFILREHDARDDDDRDLIHIEHAIHCCVFEGRSYSEFTNEYWGDYQNSQYWIEMVEAAGFKLVLEMEPRDINRYQYLVFRAV